MKDKTKITVEELAIYCKKKGFVFQAAEIYGGLAGFFDYGPLGVELKNNLKNLYRKNFVYKRQNVVEQDGSIITNPKVWKASGHIDNFADLILTTKDTKTKVRADHFIEDELNIPGDSLTAEDINGLIKKHDLKLNGEEFEEVNSFNLMFQTQVGADTTKNSTSYLRPETCQSIFPNFRNIAEVSRQKLPFGIFQVGKAFRNEISPRDFIFRCREFEQLEMEFFFHPDSKCDLLDKEKLALSFQFLSAKSQENDTEEMEICTIKQLIDSNKVNSWQAYWLGEFFSWFNNDIGLDYTNLRVREHTSKELSHYSKATFDIDFKFPMGFKELFGLANRGDFDLKQHQEHSKTKLEIFDEETKSKILPQVIEPSLGVERFFMAVLTNGLIKNDPRGNDVLSIDPKLSPVNVAVFPLMNKPELTSKAIELFDSLIDNDIKAFYDKSGSVGRRYARQDEIGTPFCITVDYESIEDGSLKDTITIRDRDSTNQKRIHIKEAPRVLRQLIKGNLLFEDL